MEVRRSPRPCAAWIPEREWYLGIFAGKQTITAPQVADELGLSEGMARNLLRAWMEDGWLEVTNPSRRARSYSLSAKYRQYIGSLSAIVQGGEKNEQ